MLGSRMLAWPIDRTRQLVFGLGQYGLLLGPVRRALVEPAAGRRDDLLQLLLCFYGKRLWQAGLVAGKCGNLSARSHDPTVIYVTPRAQNKSRLGMLDIRRVELGVDDRDRSDVSVELPMHVACYRARAAVGAVIHTHAPALTALGIRGLSLDTCLPEAAEALGGVTVLPYLPSGSDELGDAVGDAVARGVQLVVLERHGVVSVGARLSDAYDRMEFGELSAKTALLAAS